MAQGILLDESNILEVKIKDEHYQVSYGFHRLAWFHCDDHAAIRMVSVQLANMGISKTRISEAFDVNRRMIYKWISVYEQQGIRGVVLLKKGPEAKLSESIKDYI